MKRPIPITTLFVDVGGVLLNNGWDHLARRAAATAFKVEWDEMEERHRLNFAIFEEGKLTLDDYLGRTVFYRERSFTRDQFREFMFGQSESHPEMIDLIARVKVRYGLKVVVVSNESREVNAYRINTFELDRIVDFYVSSCFVRLRKPDLDVFRLALDVANATPDQVVYVENTPMFVQLAEGLGINSILHVDCKSTGAKLASFGLQDDVAAR